MLSAANEILGASMSEEAKALFAVWRNRFETRTRRALTKNSTRRQLGFNLLGMVELSSHCFLCLVRPGAKNMTVKLVAKVELDHKPLGENDKRDIELARNECYRLVSRTVGA